MLLLLRFNEQMQFVATFTRKCSLHTDTENRCFWSTWIWYLIVDQRYTLGRMPKNDCLSLEGRFNENGAWATYLWNHDRIFGWVSRRFEQLERRKLNLNTNDRTTKSRSKMRTAESSRKSLENISYCENKLITILHWKTMGVDQQRKSNSRAHLPSSWQRYARTTHSL